MSKDARLSDIVSALEKKSIPHKTWSFASGAVRAIECDGIEIWSREIENEACGVLTDVFEIGLVARPDKSFISYDLQSDDVYDSEGNIVGQEDYVLIEKLFVAPAARRRGKGRSMLREALAEIVEQHLGMAVKVAALPFGENAIDMADLVAFYESEGFSIDNCNGHAVIMKL